MRTGITSFLTFAAISLPIKRAQSRLLDPLQ